VKSPAPTLAWAVPAAALAAVAAFLAAAGRWPLAVPAAVAAALLLVPQTRAAGRWAAFLALLAGSALEAFEPGVIPGGSVAVHGLAALLMGLLLLGPDLEHTLALTALLALGPLYLGARVAGARAAEVLEATREGSATWTEQHAALPDVLLRAEDGTTRPAAEALRPGDLVAFVRSDCPACRRLVPAWRDLALDLGTRGRRLVFVATDPEDRLEPFAEDPDLRRVARLALDDGDDAPRFGLDGVPYVLALDAEGRIEFGDRSALAPPFEATLAHLERASPGLGEQVRVRLVETLFGAGATAAAPLAPGALIDAPVLRDGTPAGRLRVLSSPVNSARHLEVALALDPEGRLLAVLPLAAGPRLSLVGTPDLRDLTGLAPDAAARLCLDRADEMTLDRPFWLALASLLARGG
jgi:hypothetical protein